MDHGDVDDRQGRSGDAADPAAQTPAGAPAASSSGLIAYQSTAVASRNVAIGHASSVGRDIGRALLNWFWVGLASAIFVGAFSLLLAIYSVMAVFMMMGAVNYASARARVRRTATVVQRLAQAVELGQPLPGALRAAAGEERGATGRALRSLGTLIDDGMPLPAALSVAAPWVGYGVIDAVAAADLDGTLPVTLARLSDRSAEEAAGERAVVGRTRLSMAYPMYVLVLLLLAILLVGVSTIGSRLGQIQHDFRMVVPKSAVITVLKSNGPVLAVVVGIMLVLLMGWNTAGRLRGRIMAATRWAWGRIGWYLPVVHGVVLSRGMAEVMCGASEAVEAGRPLPEAAALRGGRYLNVVLDERVKAWQAGMAAGVDPAEAARRARLPALVSGLLGPAMRSGSMPQTLRFLAAYYQTRLARAAALLRESSDCACVLIGAGIVWMVAQTFLLPFWAMLDALSKNVWR